MYCDTTQVNQLTALLVAYTIRNAVVCPGSRNATIVHNLYELHRQGKVSIHPVTDERSAAFVALGMSLATQEPTIVCVTSGTALLNCVPAVAEAYYRHLPLLVISADRPQQWIGQYDGQTLQQTGALEPYCKTAQINPPRNEGDSWVNNLHINEALNSLYHGEGGPAHINVAIEEPMFSFNTVQLPNERVISVTCPTNSTPIPQNIVDIIANAKLPVLLIGQYERGDIRKEVADIVENKQMLVLPEIISDVPGNHLLNAFDYLSTQTDALKPDLVVQIGGNFVHKSFKSLLRNTSCCVIRIDEEQGLIDTFCHLQYKIQSAVQPALAQLSMKLPRKHEGVAKAERRLADTAKILEDGLLADEEHLTMNCVIRHLYMKMQTLACDYTLHLANSSSVRIAGNYFKSGVQPILCNRGVNGIEGSLSAAVGYAMKMWGLSIVIIGDLSFFYDANALWNVSLPSNLRILLLNNNHGSIFDQLKGLEKSPARDKFIAAGQQTYTAAGIAQTFHIGYTGVQNFDDLRPALEHFIVPDGGSQIVEVFVNG